MFFLTLCASVGNKKVSTSSRTVLNNGKSGGIIVLILKESILRVITFWKCSEKYMIKKKDLVIFGSPLVDYSQR